MPRKAHLFLFYAWLVSESMFNRASEPLLTPMSEKSPLHGASKAGKVFMDTRESSKLE